MCNVFVVNMFINVYTLECIYNRRACRGPNEYDTIIVEAINFTLWMLARLCVSSAITQCEFVEHVVYTDTNTRPMGHAD